jgi:hypothetical protein
MGMGWLFLGFIVMIAAFTLMTYVVGRWISTYVQRHIQNRLDALHQIVNEERVPSAWLKPYRKRAARLLEAGADESRIRKLELAARKQCRSRIEELKRYAVGSGVADSGDTRNVIATSLDEQAERWRDDEEWHKLVDLTKPEPVVSQDEASAREDEADWNGRDHNRD